MLVSKGYLTEDDSRLKDQIWTAVQDIDGTQETCARPLTAKEQNRDISQPTMPDSASFATSAWMALDALVKEIRERKEAQALKAARKGEAASSVALRAATNQGHADPAAPSWKQVQERLGATKIPELKVITRKRGAKPTRKEGQDFWEFIDMLVVDLMIISRQATTWKQYRAWFEVFEEFATILKVDLENADIEVLRGVLVRSLVVLFYEGGYAPKTLEIYTTAVASMLKDRQKGDIRASGDLYRLMEGIRRSMGVMVRKKLAVEGIHVNAWLEMGYPDRDGRAWTGKHHDKQWDQFVAVTILGWVCFLRVSEIIGLRVCHLTWIIGISLAVLVVKAKADQRGVTTTTIMDAAEPESPVCLLNIFMEYMQKTHHEPRQQTDGSMVWKLGHCTLGSKHQPECEACPYVFPKISVRGVKHSMPASERTLRLRLKDAMLRCMELGLVESSAIQDYSMISLRRGGNSTACAHGVRQRVRDNHGRWGLSGKVEKGLTSENEYNSVLSRENGVVCKALHKEINDARLKRTGLD